MKIPNYQEALNAFAYPPHDFTVEELGNGLINQTFKVTSNENGTTFLLQEINDNVFSNPEHIQLNYEMLWKHMQTEECDFVIPEPKYFSDKSPLYFDSHNHYWRIFEFMPGTKTLTTASDVNQVRAVAETFAGFTACFKSFDAKRLYPTITRFHNLSLRYKQFNSSLHSRNYERLSKASVLVEELKKREHYVSFYDVITESEEFPVRVLHHDAKIANVLFDEDTGEVVCPVDFDTVMPGYFFSDLGDMIRTMTCTKAEGSTAFDEIGIRGDFYQALLDGYLSILGNQLTNAEKKYIHFSGLCLIYMQALRFLADYLNGDTYYKTTYIDQNVDRAKNQVQLLQKLEDFLQLTFHFKI